MGDGWRYNLTVVVNMKKVLIAGVMALSVLVACKTGLGDALIVIVPVGLYGLFSKEV